MRRARTFATLGAGDAAARVRTLVRAEALAAARIEGVLRFGRPAALVDALFVRDDAMLAVTLLVPTVRAAAREAPPFVWPERIASALDDATGDAIDALLAPWTFDELAGTPLPAEASVAFTAEGGRLLARARGLALPGAAPLDRVARALAVASVVAPFARDRVVRVGHADGRAGFGVLAAAGARFVVRDDDDAFAARWFAIAPVDAPHAIETADAGDAVVVTGDVSDLSLLAHDPYAGLATAGGTRPPRRIVFGAGSSGLRVDPPGDGASSGIVAVAVRDDAPYARDADVAAADALAARLRAAGLTAGLVPFAAIASEGYDLVHIVGAEPPDLALAALRRVRAGGIPVVVTPLAPAAAPEAAWEARTAVQAAAHRVDEAATLPLLAAFAARRLAVDAEPATRVLAEEAAANRLAIRAEADLVCDAPPFVEDGAPFAVAFDVLVVAAIEPRANLIAAVRAATDAGLRLVLVGPIVDPAYFAYAAAFGGPGFAYLGDPSDADTARLAASARIYLDAAFAPRGGARVLAAARAGIPVVTTGRDDLPGFAGEGVAVVDPCSIEAIANGLAQAARWTDRIRARLAERAKAFASPPAATRIVLGLYAGVAQRGLNSATAPADTIPSNT